MNGRSAGTLAADAAGGIRPRLPGARATRTAWLLIAPTMIAMFLVGFYPMLRTFYLSLTKASFFAESTGFAGMSNYARLIGDSMYLRALFNSIVFTLASVAAEVVLGIAFALILKAAVAGRQMLRAINLLPYVIPLTVASQLWKWMYHDVFGVINDFLVRTGLLAEPVAWLDNPATSMAAIVAVAVWKFTPFVALLVLASMQSINEEVYESAAIDGAGSAVKFTRITLPLIKETVVIASIFRMLDAIRVFDIVYVLKENAVSTMSLAIYARQQLIDFGQLGYGSAVSVSVLILVLIGTAVYLRLAKVGLD